MNGVGYLTLATSGAKPVKLVAVETPAARSATIHQSSMANGVSSMRAVTGGRRSPPAPRSSSRPAAITWMLMGRPAPRPWAARCPDPGVRGRLQAAHRPVGEAGAPKADPMAGMHMDH